MDSFYDVPRRAPVPTQVEKFCGAPVVPEVSMLSAQRQSINAVPSYNTWKINQVTQNINVLTSNKQNIMKGPHNLNNPRPFASPENSSQFLRKQVRFETPVLQQRPSLTLEPFNTRKMDCRSYKISPDFINDLPRIRRKQDCPVKQTEPSKGQTFEEMYMANVPNRHLDLSLIDVPNNPQIVEKSPAILEDKELVEVNSDAEIVTETQENKENKLPKTYREFLETQKKVAKGNKVDFNDSVTDIFNYKRNNVLNCEEPLEIGDVPKKCSGTPKSTVSDFRIDLKDETHTERFVRYLPDYEKSIKDVEIKRSESPVYIKYLPSYEYSQNKFKPDHLRKFRNSLPQCDSITQTSLECVMPETESPRKPKDDSEPTNKKLLQIIARQNEQLLILQKQVAILLNNNQQNAPRQIAAAPPRVNYRNEKCVTSTQNENFLSPSNTPSKRSLSKFSIDLMTSFEVAIRQQHNTQNLVNYEPKLQEVTELDSVTTGYASAVDKDDKTVVDTSLHLQEPVKVRETCPSPEPSININMNDYDSSEEEISASDIGATFYDNLMGQVNNILRKAQAQAKEDLAIVERRSNTATKVKDKTMSRVREATLKHLRNLGVTIGPIDDSDDSSSSENDGKDYSPTEISFAVKQLLMKYLPDEQLAKISHKQAQSTPTTRADGPGIINARPEFSFASVQYMRKYNLIPTNNERKPRDSEQVPKAPQSQKLEGPKILDITALKLQPKLL